MMAKTLKILLGVSLIPFCAGFTYQFASTAVSVRYRPDVPYYFLLGGFAYVAAHILFRRPILTYVFGHELTHALFAMIFGGSVKSFHASERGGRVTITKSNFIITLAPYFFPLYTFFVLVLYWLASAADVRGVEGWLVFLSGATFAFHIVLTLLFLRTDQDDIREHGTVFSYPLIYVFNVVFAGLLVYLLLAEDMSFPKFLFGGIIKSIDIIALTGNKVYFFLASL